MPPNVYERKKVKVAQLFQTLCYPHGLNSPGQNTRMGSCSLLQGIFSTQGSNPSLPKCRGILCQLSHQGSPRRLEGVAYPFSSRPFQPRNRTGSSALQADSLPTELLGKCSSIIFNSQDTATIQVPIKRQIDEEGVLYPTPHNKITINI